MGKVITELSVSLDGFVAGPNDSPALSLGEGGDRLFAWYFAGDTALPLPGTEMTFRVSRASADFLRESWERLGAMVIGRRMFDITEAWHGNPPGGGPCFVVSHTADERWTGAESPFTFVTDGVESAIRRAREAAGDKDVSVGSATIMQQAIAAGLLDEVQLDLVPVFLGGGVRLFDQLGASPPALELLHVIEAPGVTHLRYRVVK